MARDSLRRITNGSNGGRGSRFWHGESPTHPAEPRRWRQDEASRHHQGRLDRPEYSSRSMPTMRCRGRTTRFTATCSASPNMSTITTSRLLPGRRSQKRWRANLRSMHCLYGSLGILAEPNRVTTAFAGRSPAALTRGPPRHAIKSWWSMCPRKLTNAGRDPVGRPRAGHVD